jgi:hypothetical protein
MNLMSIKNPPKDKSMKSPTGKEYMFPNPGIVIVAKNIEEAEKKFRATIKKDKK